MFSFIHTLKPKEYLYVAGLSQMLGGVMRMLGYDETRLAGMGVNMVTIVMMMIMRMKIIMMMTR